MKWCYALAAIVLTCVFGLPFSEYDTASLLPIKTIQAARTRDGVTIVSEVGQGVGETWSDAVSDLRENAPGEVFFETAEQVIFCSRTLASEAVESGDLRPSAQVYFARKLCEPEGLNAYLSAHVSNLTVADLRAEHYI